MDGTKCLDAHKLITLERMMSDFVHYGSRYSGHSTENCRTYQYCAAVNISRFRLLKNTHWLRTFEIVNRHSSLLAKPCITIANMKSISIY
jgi:hypothetical protein